MGIAEDPDQRRTRRGRHRRRRRVYLASALLALLLPAGLFAFNGWVLASGQVALGSTAPPTTAAPTTAGRPRLKVMAWNLAKAFLHRGGLWFDSAAAVRQRVLAMAAVIRAEDPDLVFLSEVVTECGLCDVDQLALLRAHSGLRYWAFGENYNFGLPGFRIVGGNAILSRFPLQPRANPDLAGRRPFWITRNNRRVLIATSRLHGHPVQLYSIHNDSFDAANNLAQIRQILARCADRDAVLAGDFNADPDSASIHAVLATGRFAGAAAGGASYPATAPRRRIDFAFAPASWQCIGSRVLDDRTSDHRPVVTEFRLPSADRDHR